MGAADEDFDVEEWNRRLDATPSGPSEPRLRTRHLDRPQPGGLPPEHPATWPWDDDVTGGAEAAAEASAHAGFPEFQHGQWTVEGEIERVGAFGRGAARSRGWRRRVAVALLALLVLPLVVQAAQLASRMFS